MFQMASFWPQICTKSIFGWGLAQDPTGELMTLPRFLIGWWGGTCFLLLDAGISISARRAYRMRLWWGPTIMVSRAALWLSIGLVLIRSLSDTSSFSNDSAVHGGFCTCLLQWRFWHLNNYKSVNVRCFCLQERQIFVAQYFATYILK